MSASDPIQQLLDLAGSAAEWLHERHPGPADREGVTARHVDALAREALEDRAAAGVASVDGNRAIRVLAIAIQKALVFSPAEGRGSSLTALPAPEALAEIRANDARYCDAVLSELDEAAAAVRQLPAGAPQYVTLHQMAAIVNRSKKTLERLKTREKNPLPPPDVEGGGGGKLDEWEWSKVRPWLAAEFGKNLPERFPERFHVRR
jgi:hypothetical protein